MPAIAPRSGMVATLIMVMAHGILWLPFFLGLIFMVPRLERTFRDFDMKLPRLAEELMAASRLTTQYSFILPLIVLPLLAVDGLIYYFLLQGMLSRAWSRTWAALMCIIPLLALALLAIGLWLPLVKLLEGLSK